MTRLHSYVVARDFGFAPNPFFGFCTLATCKPKIRSVAAIGDWVIGTGSRTKQRDGHLVFAMRVSETLSFGDYRSATIHMTRVSPSSDPTYAQVNGKPLETTYIGGMAKRNRGSRPTLIIAWWTALSTSGTCAVIHR